MNNNLESLLGIKNCNDCALSKNRKNIVIGEGNEKSHILIIGEAPGKKEDIEKKPFVGRAGNTLDSLLKKIDLNRQDTYITNVVKCKPPSNRDPKKKEMQSCEKYLEKQIDYINPSVIISLGRVSSKRLTGEPISLNEKHGTITETLEKFGKRKLFITYHPAACLYNKNLEKVLEKDFQKIKTFIQTLNEFKK